VSEKEKNQEKSGKRGPPKTFYKRPGRERFPVTAFSKPDHRLPVIKKKRRWAKELERKEKKLKVPILSIRLLFRATTHGTTSSAQKKTPYTKRRGTSEKKGKKMSDSGGKGSQLHHFPNCQFSPDKGKKSEKSKGS